jgi:signal transduction histidine kinase
VQLQQVLLNLITNAIDAMAASDAGERVLWVRSSNETANSVTISVEDNGTGVEPKDMDLIFNPLFTTKTQGMGMGLTICRSIVEAHDGRLWATPNRPRGSRISVQPAGNNVMIVGVGGRESPKRRLLKRLYGIISRPVLGGLHHGYCRI